MEENWREKQTEIVKEAKTREDELRRLTKAHDKLKEELGNLQGDAYRKAHGPTFLPQIATSPLLARVARAVELQMRARIQSLVLVPSKPGNNFGQDDR